MTLGSQALFDGLTIARIHGNITMWLEVVGSIGDGFDEAALGICNVSENAFGVGITAIPFPIADVGWEGWMFHKQLGPIVGLSVTEGENTGPISQVRLDFQTKSMRKTKASDVLVAVMELGTEIGVATLTLAMTSRVLDLQGG